MTIYLHYKKIAHLLSSEPSEYLLSSNLQKKQKIHAYRNAFLMHKAPDLQIEKTLLGKPIDKKNTIFFNHSHSSNHYALIYSHQMVDLGVDIEDIDRKANMLALAHRYFHPMEILTWKMTSYDRLFWLKVWTIKEAVLKAHGMGIRLQLNTLNTQAHAEWDFGQVEHPLLGAFFYQSFCISHAILSIAYRRSSAQLNQLENIVWI